MSDYEEVKLTASQFQKLVKLETIRDNALWRIAESVTLLSNHLQEALEINTADRGKWLSLQNEAIESGFASVVEAINKISLPQPQPKQLEVKFMFVVKDDETDKNFAVVTGDVTDAEGNKISDAAVDLAVASTNDTVVGVTFDPATKSGSVHFGNPGTATITATASSGGKLLGSGAADFTVTVGDPAAISSVGLSFDGLTEV